MATREESLVGYRRDARKATQVRDRKLKALAKRTEAKRHEIEREYCDALAHADYFWSKQVDQD